MQFKEFRIGWGKLPSIGQGWGNYLELRRDGENCLVLGRDGGNYLVLAMDRRHYLVLEVYDRANYLVQGGEGGNYLVFGRYWEITQYIGYGQGTLPRITGIGQSKLPSIAQGWGNHLVLGRDGKNRLVLGRDGEITQYWVGMGKKSLQGEDWYLTQHRIRCMQTILKHNSKNLTKCKFIQRSEG